MSNEHLRPAIVAEQISQGHDDKRANDIANHEIDRLDRMDAAVKFVFETVSQTTGPRRSTLVGWLKGWHEAASGMPLKFNFGAKIRAFGLQEWWRIDHDKRELLLVRFAQLDEPIELGGILYNESQEAPPSPSKGE
jgi:hypothetical protein